MDIKKKINAFISSSRKGDIIIDYLARGIQQIRYRHKFAQFGMGARLIAPDRLLGCRNISLGGGVTILHHARMEAIEEYGGQQYHPYLSIGEHTSIGQNLHLVAVGRLVIGKNVTMSAHVFISDVAHQYRECGVHVLRQPLEWHETCVDDNCFIGYGAVILPGVHLGKQCIVGANAVVLAGDYPDYSVIAGVPAKIVKRFGPESEHHHEHG